MGEPGVQREANEAGGKKEGREKQPGRMAALGTWLQRRDRGREGSVPADGPALLGCWWEAGLGRCPVLALGESRDLQTCGCADPGPFHPLAPPSSHPRSFAFS